MQISSFVQSDSGVGIAAIALTTKSVQHIQRPLAVVGTQRENSARIIGAACLSRAKQVPSRVKNKRPPRIGPIYPTMETIQELLCPYVVAIRR